MPARRTYEVTTEIRTYIKADDKHLADFSVSGTSKGDSESGLAKATAPGMAEALATASRMLKAVEGER